MGLIHNYARCYSLLFSKSSPAQASYNVQLSVFPATLYNEVYAMPAKFHIFHPAIFVVLLTAMVSAADVQAASPRNQPFLPSEASEMLQFISSGHVLGFHASGVYVAAGSHMLREDFAGTAGTIPQADRPRAKDGQAQPLGTVSYPGLWEGITLVYDHPPGGILRSTYQVDPGSDPGQIALSYNVPVRLGADGCLIFQFATGTMTASAPVAWQDVAGKRLPVDAAFCLDTDQVTVKFSLGAYNPALPLTIDPTLSWHTFLGTSSTNEGKGIAVDSSGNVYVAGQSYGTWGTPVTAYVEGGDAFVAKLNSSGERQWNTFMGSSSADYGMAIAVDDSENVYVGGYSNATWGSPENAHAGGNDAFAAKLDSCGGLQWHTFMGSSDNDHGHGIALDAGGNVYLGGWSETSWGNPVNNHAGTYDAFAAKLNSSGERQWHTFMGSSSADYGMAIAVDDSENVYVGGYSNATWGSPENAHAGGNDAFAAKLDSCGGLQWHTFMGSSDNDKGHGIAVDGSGNVYVGGWSETTWGTPKNNHAGFYDAFAAKLNSSGERQWHTFMGSSSADYGMAIAVDGSANVYVAGYSHAAWGSPVNDYAGGGNDDAFAAKLDSEGARQWHTFMGSTATDQGYAIAVDSSGNVYVAGISYAAWGSPVNAHAGGSDAFAVKLNNSGVRQWHTFMGSSTVDKGNAIAVDGRGRVFVAGWSYATWGSPWNPFAGDYDAFAAGLTGSGVRQWNTFMGSSDADWGFAAAVDSSGNVYVAGESDVTWGSPVSAHTGGAVDVFAAKILNNIVIPNIPMLLLQ